MRYLWPDVHQALAAKIRQQLAPRLRPRYVTRLGLAVLSEEPDEAEVKVTDMYQASVHVLEIDLLRRGVRIHADARLQAAAYLLTLTRAMESKLEAWPLQLADKLPIVPVPLRPPDADVPLDLHAALNEIYDEAAYDLSIDYRQPPPPPPLSPNEAEWLRTVV